MKSFDQWCEEMKYKLPELTETPPTEDSIGEGSTKRAGVRNWAYPALYSRGQYTKSDLRATAADAVTYQDDYEQGE